MWVGDWTESVPVLGGERTLRWGGWEGATKGDQSILQLAIAAMVGGMEGEVTVGRVWK